MFSLQAMGRRRRVAEPFLRHEGGAEPAPRLDAEAADGPPSMRMASCRSAQALAGQGGEELALAVAGDAGDAEDFAAGRTESRCPCKGIPCVPRPRAA